VYWKGIGVFGEDKGFHSTPLTHPSPSLRATLQLWYNLHSYYCLPKGEKVVPKGLYFTQVSVFGDSCQRGRKYQPKAKGPHHHQILKTYDFQIDISLCSKGGESSIFKIDVLKPSWTLRGSFIEGEFCLVKGKAFETREKFSNLINASQKSYSFTFD
jgi:hypothetical protein